MMELRSKFKIKSLKWQLLFRFLIVLIVLIVIMVVFQYKSMKADLYETKRQVLHQRFHNLDFVELSKQNTVTEKTAMEILSKLVSKNMSTAVINKDGELMFEKSNTDAMIPRDDNDGDDDSKEIDEKMMPKLQVPEFSKEQYINILKQPGNIEHEYYIVKDRNDNYQMVSWMKIGDISSPSGLIQLSTPVQDIRGILARQLYVNIGLSIFILVIGTLLGTAIFKRTLSPLYKITDTVEGISVTDLDTRLKEENGQLEIDKLAKSFNIMLARIQDSFEKEQAIKEKMRRFVSDASHELRTPLTSIHGFVEILLRGAAKNKDQLDLALNSILIESERLTKLVNDLLILTKLDQKPVIEMKRENINELIQEIHPQLQILCQNRTLKFELMDNIQAIINRDQIKQVIFNLTQNAVLHTDKENGVIKISTDIKRFEDKNFVVLRIADNGTGIPEKDIAKIYDRFFRSDTHRSREQGGYGLGLSIVKSIIDSSGGEIKVESKLNVGTVFTVYLKRNT
jgi:two-component system OmpR family sensor kinase